MNVTEGNFVSSTLLIVRRLMMRFQINFRLTVSLISFDMMAVVSGLESWSLSIISSKSQSR